MLKQRLLTAVVLIPLVILAVLYLPQSLFALLFGVIIMLCGWEWSAMVSDDIPLRAVYLALLGFLMLMAERMFGATESAVLGLFWWGASFYWVIRFPTAGQLWRASPIMRAIAGLLVLIPAFVSFVALRELAGPLLTLLLLLIIWAADTGAYFAGRAFGKHKLAPKVSPGKTWEGVAGGTLLAMLVAGGGHLYLSSTLNFALFLALCLLTIAVSIQGDLLESMFKRITRIKDSGGLLPGHGGLLDRLDSLTAAAPVFYLGVLWLVR